MKWTSAAFFFLIFFNFAFAQSVFVSIEPMQGNTSLEMYSLEVKEFELVVVNNSTQPLSNFNVLVSASSEIILVSGGEEKKQEKISFVSIAPKAIMKRQILVKGKSASDKKAVLKADYGFDEFLQSYSLLLSVKKSPLEFNARLLKTAMEPLEENNVAFDLVNLGESSVSNINVSLSLPQGFEDKDRHFSLNELVPGQSVLNSRLGFSSGEEPFGEQKIIVTASYEDELGRHQAKEFLEVDVRERTNYLVMIAIIVIVLGALVFFYKKRKNPPLHAR